GTNRYLKAPPRRRSEQRSQLAITCAKGRIAEAWAHRVGALPEIHGYLRMNTHVGAKLEAPEVEQVTCISGRRLKTPGVHVQPLVEAKRRRLKAVRQTPGRGEPLPGEGKLLQRTLGDP